MKGFKVIIIAMGLAFTQAMWAQSSPVPMLENTATQIIDTLKKNQASL